MGVFQLQVINIRFAERNISTIAQLAKLRLNRSHGLMPVANDEKVLLVYFKMRLSQEKHALSISM